MKQNQNPLSSFQKSVSPYPETNLFIGVLREAWVDAFLPNLEHKTQLTYIELHQEKNRKDAIKFMEGSEKAWDESFHTICELLNIEAAILRKAYFSFKHYYATQKQLQPEDAFNIFIWSMFDA